MYIVWLIVSHSVPSSQRCFGAELATFRKKERNKQTNNKPQEKHPQELELRHLGEMAEFQNFPFSILKQFMKQNLRKVF